MRRRRPAPIATRVAISRRRITLSTAGVVPMIRRCGEELGVSLAISLHAVRNDLRMDLKHIEQLRTYPVRSRDLVAAEIAARWKAYTPPKIENQTPWQEMYRGAVGQLAGGGCLEPATHYHQVVKQVPRHSH